jgi:hypothetical protein
MVATAFLLAILAAAGPGHAAAADSVESMLSEESADVFLAKATLQQYLSRIVRKDWDGVRRLTHPKALAKIDSGKKKVKDPGALAPWQDDSDQLKTFEFRGAKQVAPGVVMVAVGEDVYHSDEQGMSTGDPSVYLLFKSRNGFLVGDKVEGVGLGKAPGEQARNSYPGWVDHQVQAQARRTEAIRNGRHR